MTSVERVVQFTSLPREDSSGPPPPAGWPKRARLVFKDLTLRYDKDADPVLKKLNIVIESGWKVGILFGEYDMTYDTIHIKKKLE